MPTVYVRSQPPRARPVRKFHRSPGCPQLTKGPARGTIHDTEEADLRDLDRVIPCRSCYPDAPVVAVARRRCPECNKGAARPCPHNGGIRIVLSNVTKVRTPYREVGDVFPRQKWIWPDHLYRYINLS